MAKSPEQMAAAMIRNLKAKTGKTLPQWLKIVTASKLDKHGKIVAMLEADHGVTHGFANLIAHQALAAAGGKPAADNGGDDLVEAQYVSLRRSKQFAIVQPSTKTRVDPGLDMKGEPTTERLEASGSFNQMVSHRVRLTRKADVDAELRKWLKRAYQGA